MSSRCFRRLLFRSAFAPFPLSIFAPKLVTGECVVLRVIWDSSNLLQGTVVVCCGRVFLVVSVRLSRTHGELLHQKYLILTEFGTTSAALASAIDRVLSGESIVSCRESLSVSIKYQVGI